MRPAIKIHWHDIDDTTLNKILYGISKLGWKRIKTNINMTIMVPKSYTTKKNEEGIEIDVIELGEIPEGFDEEETEIIEETEGE